MSDSFRLLSSPNFVAVFERQRAAALRLRTSTATERIEKLKRLRAAVIAYTDTWRNAGWADFRTFSHERGVVQTRVGLATRMFKAGEVPPWMSGLLRKIFRWI